MDSNTDPHLPKWTIQSALQICRFQCPAGSLSQMKDTLVGPEVRWSTKMQQYPMAIFQYHHCRMLSLHLENYTSLNFGLSTIA
jgi:hypothetical protein